MFSQMLSIKSIKPNPNYVPGGVENFWLTGSSNPEKKDEMKVGEERGPGPGFARFGSSYDTEKTRREETSQRPETEVFGVGPVRGSFVQYETWPGDKDVM